MLRYRGLQGPAAGKPFLVLSRDGAWEPNLRGSERDRESVCARLLGHRLID